MTATYTYSIACDECGTYVTGQPNETVDHLRYRIQQHGWETLRVGNGVRDLCVPCALRRREVAA